jgi:hypothetical protein
MIIERKEREENKMTKAIYFDMDGTIANLYGVENWLDMIIARDETPYREAKPLINLNSLARILNRLQAQGYVIGIVSWLAKGSTAEYDKAVERAKVEWLRKHLASVHFNEIHIVEYGTPKEKVVLNPLGILFDDEERNRTNWTGIAYDVNNIIEILKEVA